MIIAIDGYEANVSNRVGIGRYAFEILEHIYKEFKSQKLKVNSNNAAFRIYLPDKPLPDMPDETEWWKYRVAGPKKLWTFIGLPWALAKDYPKAEVVFSPTHYSPRFTTIPRVISIMDLSYLRHPEMFKAKDLHQLVNWTRYSVSHAVRVFTISRFSKNAIISEYGIPADRVVVTYPGFDMIKTTGEKEIISKYNLPKNYVLSVGTLQPRKNYVRLIEAFSRVSEELTSKYRDLALVIVGKKGWLYEEILEAPRKYGITGKVKFLDFVPDSDLPGLYKGALLFALPSLYEGFGLPVLEAMSYGIPVVVSDISSLPEIAGDAGFYVKAEDTGSIAQGLMSVLKDPKAQSVRDKVNKGLTQIKRFSWDKAAKKTLSVLVEVGKGKI